MPEAVTVTDLDNIVLGAHYDSGSLARGRGYADEDRIRLLGLDTHRIKAVCKGSGKATYILSVAWERLGGRIVIDDSCSCPLGGACKHCVAAILTVRNHAMSGASTAAPLAAPSSAPSSMPRAEWRRLLGPLAPIGDDTDPHLEGLALQLAVRPPNNRRYGGSTSATVTIRPMRQGRSGRWIKSGASWRDIATSYSYRLDDADPRHLAVLRTMLAGSPQNRYPDDRPIPLAEFGFDVWHQLERAVGAGIVLIGEHNDTSVELSPTPAQAEVDLTADPSGTVTIATRVVHDDTTVVLDGRSSGPLGAPPHGLWAVDGNRLRLIPLAAPLHPAVTHLLQAGSIDVPPVDVDEMLDVYQPELARHAAVSSSDGSVTMTSSEFDRLLLVVERPALDEAVIEWKARYRRGSRAVDHPLFRPSGRHRDRAAEASAVAGLQLPTHIMASLTDVDDRPYDHSVRGSEAVVLLTEVVPWLEANGAVDVEVRGEQPPLREAVEDPLISLRVTDGSDGSDGGGRGDSDDADDGNDWFDLGVDVSVDGQTVEFAGLFAALNHEQPAMILESGTVLRLDRPEFAQLRELITEARGLVEPTGDGAARVNRFQTSWWDELVGLGVVAEQSKRWAVGVEHMRALAAPEPVPPPERLEAKLRPYQQEGLDWLVFLHQNRLGGILGDDMGLGKTIQTLALALHILEEQPDARFLVVAPTSVVDNWAREAARFAPDIEVRTVSETAKRRGTTLAEHIGDATLVITSYALFRIEIDDYVDHGWEVLLLDEAQFVKNHTSKTYQCVRRLRAPTKIAMTGTPMENSLMDLWSLLSITAPGLYPDPKRFSDTFRKPIERGDAPELLDTLRRRIAPLIRRRTKDAVLDDLPPKTELTVDVDLSPRHARIYATQLQRQRQKVLGLVDDVQTHRFEILKSLTILRQLALDPGLVDDAHDGVGSAKLDRLLDDLTQVVAEGHRALVFSQFTRYLAKVRARLDDAGIAYSYLDGRTRKRDAAITRFTEGDAPVFVISLKAGGFGLNLTQADYCFILDPWWNPATETQAVDRTHRIGQQNPVMVYRYVSVDTIEEKVMELKARKADLFSSVMDAEGALSGALSEDDIRGLLDLGP